MLSRSSEITTERSDARGDCQEAQLSLLLSERTLSAEDDPGAAPIPLRHGGIAWVDVDMVDELCNYWWSPNGAGYAKASMKITDRDTGATTWINVFMHRMVVGLGSHLLCDHKNRRVNDNRRCNLRLATPLQNAINRGRNKTRANSRYKGVRFCEDHANKPWYMRLKVNRVTKHMRSFETEREAAIAYDILARREWGEYACLNIPDAPIEEVDSVRSILENPKRFNGSSKFVGVTKIHDSRWVAKVKINGKHFYIATRKTEREAAQAYNDYVVAHGTGAQRLNVI